MRHGSAGRFPTRLHVILNRFELHDSDLLGKGSESSVFAMNDPGHVLRVYHEHVPWDYMEARRLLSMKLAQAGLPFAVPEIYSVGAWVGHIYTVEQRMDGQDFSKVLPTLSGGERAKALTNYLDAAAALGQVRFDDTLFEAKPYGELLLSPALQSESWQAYLRERMETMLVASRADLEADVPGFDQVLAQIYAQFPLVGDSPEKSLVHGDFYPANVFINDALEIVGVGDFSYATTVGDARLDIAGAVWLLGAMAGSMPEDSAFLRSLVAQRWGDEMGAVVDFYRLYYSVYFSGCKADDPTTYWWCVENLRSVG